MKTGLRNKEEFLRYREWFEKTYPIMPFFVHPNFVREYNRSLEKASINKNVCARCGGTGIIKGGPTDSRPDSKCTCQELNFINATEKEEIENDNREIQKCYSLINYWSSEAHKWRDAYVTLSRYKSNQHLFDDKLKESESFLIGYPNEMTLSKDKLSNEEIIS